jgi:segregation and condensation protein B
VEAVEPPAAEAESPVVVAAESPVAAAAEPPAVEAVEPPAAEAESPVVEAAESPAVEAAESPVAAATEPPAAAAAESPAVEAAEPSVVDAVEPSDAVAAEPPFVEITEPPEGPALEAVPAATAPSDEPSAPSEALEPSSLVPAGEVAEPLGHSSAQPPSGLVDEPLVPESGSPAEPPVVEAAGSPVVEGTEPHVVEAVESSAVEGAEPSEGPALEAVSAGTAPSGEPSATFEASEPSSVVPVGEVAEPLGHSSTEPLEAPAANVKADTPTEGPLSDAADPSGAASIVSDTVGDLPAEGDTLASPGTASVGAEEGVEEGLLPLSDADLESALEALLLVVDVPVEEEALASALDTTPLRVAERLRLLSDKYTDQDRGIDLRRAGGGWRFYTRDRYAPYVEKLLLDGQRAKLTRAALETLAVIAYRQPVTRARVAAVRGVNCDGVIRTLLARGLVEESGTDQETGGFLYRTTELFLERLGLSSLDDLPPIAPLLPEVDSIDEL